MYLFELFNHHTPSSLASIHILDPSNACFLLLLEWMFSTVSQGFGLWLLYARVWNDQEERTLDVSYGGRSSSQSACTEPFRGLRYNDVNILISSARSCSHAPSCRVAEETSCSAIFSRGVIPAIPSNPQSRGGGGPRGDCRGRGAWRMLPLSTPSPRLFQNGL